MYLYIQSAAAAAAAAPCVGILLSLLHELLLFVVCRMATIVAGSLNLTPSIGFLFILKHDLCLMCVPLGSVVAFTALICLYYILGNYGRARSQGGLQSAAAKPPLYIYILYM